VDVPAQVRARGVDGERGQLRARDRGRTAGRARDHLGVPHYASRAFFVLFPFLLLCAESKLGFKLFGFDADNYYRDVLILFAFIDGFGISVIAVVWFWVRETR
jgi:hypothetical protein